MVLDVFLIIIGMLVIMVAAQSGLLRSMLMIFVVWLISIIVGYVALVIQGADQLAQRIGSMLGGYPNNTLYEGIIFFALFIIINGAGILFTTSAFDDDALSDLGIFNTIFAVITGGVLALIIMSVICNAWGVLAQSYWQPDGAWKMMRYAYETSFLRTFLTQVMGIYRLMLFPFLFTNYPKFYNIPRY